MFKVIQYSKFCAFFSEGPLKQLRRGLKIKSVPPHVENIKYIGVNNITRNDEVSFNLVQLDVG